MRLHQRDQARAAACRRNRAGRASSGGGGVTRGRSIDQWKLPDAARPLRIDASDLLLPPPTPDASSPAADRPAAAAAAASPESFTFSIR